MEVGNFGPTSFDESKKRYTELTDNRLLELRSGLFFQYPVQQPNNQSIMFFLPFFENPRIREDNKAKLIEYNLINRNSSLFAHTGAKSRRLGVEFNLTLPHILASFNTLKSATAAMKYYSKDVSQQERQKFEEQSLVTGRDINNNIYKAGDEAYGQWKRAWKDIHAITNVHTTNDAEDTEEQMRSAYIRASEKGQTLEEEASTIEKAATHMSEEYLKTINAVVFLIDIIRSSILTNATSTALGPPMVRIRHGALYRDVPCICRGFKIDPVDSMGMDLKTLLPHKLRIVLDLAEVRTGNFGTFAPGKITDRDNVVGWESVLAGQGFDPGEARGS